MGLKNPEMSIKCARLKILDGVRCMNKAEIICYQVDIGLPNATGLIQTFYNIAWSMFDIWLDGIQLDPLQWRHNGCDGVQNHQHHDCLLNRLFWRRKKTSKLCVTGLCAGNSPVTGEFPEKRPVTRKMFPFDDVIIQNAPPLKWFSLQQSKSIVGVV